jgi:hypothetical protein
MTQWIKRFASPKKIQNEKKSLFIFEPGTDSHGYFKDSILSNRVSGFCRSLLCIIRSDSHTNICTENINLGQGVNDVILYFFNLNVRINSMPNRINIVLFIKNCFTTIKIKIENTYYRWIVVFINIQVFYVIHAHVSLYKDQTQTHSYMKF